MSELLFGLTFVGLVAGLALVYNPWIYVAVLLVSVLGALVFKSYLATATLLTLAVIWANWFWRNTGSSLDLKAGASGAWVFAFQYVICFPFSMFGHAALKRFSRPKASE